MRMGLLATVALILAGCASRDLWPVERVDPETAIHLTIMAEPWIYALDDARQAANASDFLNVAVVESNRMGTRSYWLNVVAWSTSARGPAAPGGSSTPTVDIRLGWPNRQMQLAPAQAGRAAAGASEPAIKVRAASSSDAWYPLTTAQVAELGAGAPTAVSLIDEAGRAQSYAAWQVDDSALTGFLKATGTGSP